MIKAGRNYAPQDFEAACLGVKGLRPGRAVAVGLPNAGTGTEDLFFRLDPLTTGLAAEGNRVLR